MSNKQTAAELQPRLH